MTRLTYISTTNASPTPGPVLHGGPFGTTSPDLMHDGSTETGVLVCTTETLGGGPWGQTAVVFRLDGKSATVPTLMTLTYAWPPFESDRGGLGAYEVALTSSGVPLRFLSANDFNSSGDVVAYLPQPGSYVREPEVATFTVGDLDEFISPADWAAATHLQIVAGRATAHNEILFYDLTLDGDTGPGVEDERVARLYPRDDGLGLSAGRRMHPGPRAARRVGGYL